MVKLGVPGILVLVAAIAAKKGMFWGPSFLPVPGTFSVKMRCLEEIRPCGEGGFCSETAPGIYTCCPCVKETNIFAIASNEKEGPKKHVIDTEDMGTEVEKESIHTGTLTKARYKGFDVTLIHRELYRQMWNRNPPLSLRYRRECYVTPHPVYIDHEDNTGRQHVDTCAAESVPDADFALNLRTGVNMFRLIAPL